MSRTLNLIDILLTSGRQLFYMGRYTEALTPLLKLREFRKLPREANEELQSQLAEIYLQQKKYKDARRHLAAAIGLRPLKAEYYYLMGIAIEEDDDADRSRAEMYYEQAVKLEPDQPTYWVDFGSYLFTIGKAKEALKAIGKAFKIGITDAEIVGKVAEVLRREERCNEATAKLREALFRNHGRADFRQLWQQHHFALIHADQTSPTKERSESAASHRLVLLPFQPAAQHGRYLELGAKTIRIDQAESLQEPRRKEWAAEEEYRRPPKKG